jgi:biotin carboxyl carrier protein
LFQAKVKNTEFKVNPISENEIEINGEVLPINLVSISDKKSHLILKNKSYNIEIIDTNIDKKTVTLKVNNNSYIVEVKNKFDLLLSKLGMSSMTTKVIKNIKAPMPGLVIDVITKVGDEVKEGDNLLILEAMKMENVIKSPIEGKIKAIVISATDTVEKNQLLVEFE